MVQADRHTHKGFHLTDKIFRTLPAAFLVPLMLQQDVLIIIKYFRHQRADFNILIQGKILERTADHIHVCIRDNNIGFQDI